MMKYALVLLALAAVGLSSCSREDEVVNQAPQPEWMSKLVDLQQEIGASDEEMTNAAIRWTRFFHHATEAYEDGTLTEEDIVSALDSDMHDDMLKMAEKQIAESGALLASVSLATLDGFKKGDPPLFVHRDFVAGHYNLLRRLGEKVDENDLAFMKNLEAYAKNDPELARMLEEQMERK